MLFRSRPSPNSICLSHVYMHTLTYFPQVGSIPKESPLQGGLAAPSFCYKSKLILLTAQQANKSRDKSLGQEIRTSFRKSAGQGDGGLASQRTIFPELNSGFLNTIMDGVKSWVWMCSFLPSCGHLQVGLVRKLPVG